MSGQTNCLQHPANRAQKVGELANFKLNKILIMSSRFKTINLIEVYETNGTEEKALGSDRPKIKVSEHWNKRSFVVLEIDGKKITVVADDLKRAIDNAQNAHKY